MKAAAPDSPWFLYYVPGGTHSPHNPTKQWIDKFKGKFDKGWNAMRDEIFANQKTARGDPREYAADGLAGRSAEMGQSVGRPEEAVRPSGRGLCRLCRLYRRRDRAGGQQVADMGELDNTLIIYIVGDNGTSPEGTLSGTPNQWTAYNGILDFPVEDQLKYLRRLGVGQDLSAYGGGMVLGIRHAVQVHQADRVALRRHAAGHGYVLAERHQGRRRDPQSVPPSHRHRADHPRSHRRQGSGICRWRQAEADRRHQHGLHIRQGQHQCGVDAQDPVLRDDRQPRHLSRGLVRQHDAARMGRGS